MALPLSRRTLVAAGLALPAIHVGRARAASSDRPLKLVLNVGLQTLDPIAGPSFVTRNFAYMVYDTLISMDSKGQFRPQMLEGWKITDGGMVYTFTLRPGLKFSDGQPVTSEDCIASLKRWGARDALGRRLMAATKELRQVDERNFVLELSRPFGLVLDALGKPSVQVPFIMPARIANSAPPTTPVKEIVGSGPYLFNREEWVPGERATFRRNPDYVPRNEPADGLAGGKVVKVERAELLTMPELATRAAALQTNEVDYLEYAPFDFLSGFMTNKDIVVAKAGGPALMMAALSINHLQPPFDNVLIRRAAEAAMIRSEVLDGLGLPHGLADPAQASLFMAGTFYASDAGKDLTGSSIAHARELLKTSGYKGERVVFLLPGDSALLNPIGLVMSDQLKRAGFNLDVQTQDWSSIAQRWIGRAPLDAGGWSLVPVVYPGFDMANPLSNPGVGYNCTGNQPYNYCSADLTPLIAQFEAEGDPAKRQGIAASIQKAAFEAATFPIAGQFSSPAAWRRELSGVIDFGLPIMWNIERKTA
ncbi:MAG: ABC transporter substrate-binding protein [Rhodospirillales bacterium 69-11]|nr:ABC transporter substrate-binding protein [Rhodospirillales bacterium]OJW27809.1 MAG: ABC transporter substrate-binding protein [Rhodospirillales bacterium 69-11]